MGRSIETEERWEQFDRVAHTIAPCSESARSLPRLMASNQEMLMTAQEGQPPQNPPSVPPPSDEPAQRPWRTEGVPSGQPPKPRSGWTRWALWPVGYLMLFAMFTYQDRMSGP